jgi:hypothetical protein
MRRLLSALAFAALLIGAPRAADAAITFDLTGTCTDACFKAGLNDGDAVSGSFTFDDAVIVPTGAVDETDLLSFVLDFGPVDITSATAVGAVLVATLNATATGFDSFVFFTSEALDPAEGDTIFLIDGQLAVSTNGQCINTECVARLGDPGTGVFTLTLRQIPEPGTLALLGAGLAGLAFARRRKPN